jgi:alpha-D-xyloside xylohydrolase
MMTSYNWGPWDYGDEALRNFRQYSVLHMSLFPYRYAAAQESARNGLPILRALVLMHQTDPDARAAETQYYLGPDLLVAPILSRVTQREVYLPEGEWVDYWSGQRLKGRQTLTVTAAKDRIPLYVRAGAILPKIPDDVMTLVPTSEFSNRNVQGLDNRRVYEMYPGDDPVNLRDFEGRTLARSGNSLTITGDPAHVILRWRFGSPRSVNVDGRTITLTGRANGLRTVEFDHNGTSSIRWQ